MTDAELQQINAKFNEQLQLQIEGKFPKPQYNSVDVRKQLISAAKIIESFESSKDSCTFLLINLVLSHYSDLFIDAVKRLIEETNKAICQGVELSLCFPIEDAEEFIASR